MVRNLEKKKSEFYNLSDRLPPPLPAPPLGGYPPAEGRKVIFGVRGVKIFVLGQKCLSNWPGVSAQ